MLSLDRECVFLLVPCEREPFLIILLDEYRKLINYHVPKSVWVFLIN